MDLSAHGLYALGMTKGPIRIKYFKGSKEFATFDPRLSMDCKTFVLRVEVSKRSNWFEFMNAIHSYSKEEMERVGMVSSPHSH